MVNPVLFKSSLLFGTIQLIAMIALESRNIVFNTSIIFGIITSVINHGSTTEIAKWSDRTMMLIGIYTDVRVIESMYLSPYFLSDYTFPEGNLHSLNKKMEHCPYLYIKPYLSSNWERDLYYYIYYPYICYYFLSLSILSFAMSKWIESILNSTTHNPFQKSLLYLISSSHITSHLLLTITHILMLYRLTSKL